MIKGRLDTASGPMILLGLSGENMARLMADEPILISADDLAEMGVKSPPIVIIGGKDEASMAAHLERMSR